MSKSYSIGKMDGMWGSDESGNIAQTITFGGISCKGSCNLGCSSTCTTMCPHSCGGGLKLG